MSITLTNSSANRTSLAGIGWIGILNSYADSFGFIFDKGLQLSPCPTMQSGTDTFTCFDIVPNMSQVFHRYLGGTSLLGHADDFFADYMVSCLVP